MMPRKILFIQHAGGLGGSAFSLLYTLQGLRAAGDECVVLLARPTADLARLYREAGFEVIADEPFALIDHSTVAMRPLWKLGTYTELLRACSAAGELEPRLSAIVAATRCDVVHLNSMPLVPLAHALNKMRIPYAWHVREPPPDQGLRTHMIRSVMRECRGMIFLSDYDRRRWMGGDQGEVVHNFVPDHFFSPEIDRDAVRHRLGFDRGRVVALFLGGSHPAKGGDILLRAIGSGQFNGTDVDWLIPNAMPHAPHRLISKIGRRILAALGTGPASVRFYKSLTRLSETHRMFLDDFCEDILPYFVASDIVLFPATLPHFARPVIEAAAVGRPVVASNLGGVKELIVDRITGLLVAPHNPRSLADAIRSLATDAPLRTAMGREGKELARQRFRLGPQVDTIRRIHQTVCSPGEAR